MIATIKQYFKNNYNCNLENDNFLILKDNLIIPNLYKQHLSDEMDHEFCHLIYKLFGDYYLQYGYTIYENEITQITNTSIVYDCGANIGLFSLYALNKGATVYSFEPNPFCLIYAWHNASPQRLLSGYPARKVLELI